MASPGDSFDPRTTTRPAPALLRYYTVVSLAGLIFFPIVWLVHFFKYETLRYRFDDEGVMMSWGILFRREITLTYRRIQDIHVTRNIVQRWLGLATVAVQTASGSATPEMEIEGILEFDALRDFLYAQMRGAPGTPGPPGMTVSVEPGALSPAGDETDALLRRIARDMEAACEALERAGRGGGA